MVILLKEHTMMLSSESTISHSLPLPRRSFGRLSIAQLGYICYTYNMSMKKQGSRTNRFSFYRGTDNMWHFQKTTQYAGPSPDGINRVINSASYYTLGGKGVKGANFHSSTQMVTNLPQEQAISLLRSDRKWLR